jgi:hypothetical protein
MLCNTWDFENEYSKLHQEFNINLFNWFIILTCFNLSIELIKDFENKHKFTGGAAKFFLMILRIGALIGVCYFGWPLTVWLYDSMWEIEHYGFLSWERFKNIILLRAKGLSKINLLFCLFFYIPLYVISIFRYIAFAFAIFKIL